MGSDHCEKEWQILLLLLWKNLKTENLQWVAVADNPAGPYTDKGEALMTVSMAVQQA